jgi:hypothetical protein
MPHAAHAATQVRVDPGALRGPPAARQAADGHQDSRTTADIYEQDLDDYDHAVGLLEGVLGCDLAEAHDVFAKRRVSGAKPVRDEKRPAVADLEALLDE